MSKRETAQLMQDGYSIFISDLKDLGYIPEGVVNWVALMGWSYDDKREFFTLSNLIEKFSLEHLNPAPAAINFSKLDHFNGLHIRNLPVPELARRIRPYFQNAGFPVDEGRLLQITPIIQERLVTLDEAPGMVDFMFKEVHPQPQELIGKNMSAAESLNTAQRAYQLLEALPEITPVTADAPLRELAAALNLNAGQLFGILRVAVTGRTVSPPLLESMEILGKDTTLLRLRQVIEILTTLT